jgi:hypothetical protein
VTVTDTPAIETVALRAVPELEATTRVTVAGPAPEDAPETLIQLGKPETVQVQEASVWMVKVKLPPAAGPCKAVGETE